MKKRKVIASILLTMFLVLGKNNLFGGGLIKADATVLASSQIVYPDVSDGLRILVVSDLHMYLQPAVQGLTNQQRLQFMVNSVIAENAKQHIDLCLFLGDLSENNLLSASNLTLPDKDGVAYVKKYILPSLQAKNIPAYFLSGNHDCYTDSLWKSTFGYYKTFTIECGEFAFICLDAFGDSVNKSANGSWGYTKPDATWFKQQVTKYSGKKIIVFSHLIGSGDSTLLNLISSTPNIICSFEGHTHDYLVQTRGNKPCYDVGNFSTSTPKFILNNSWGFRNLEFKYNKLTTAVIEPKYQYTNYYQPYYRSTSVTIKQF